jgi:hypothetical protein
MRKIALAALLATPLFASAATNLLTNGSFESGFTGWTVSGTAGDAYPATLITYDSPSPYPTGAFGESIPADTALNLGPDAAGTSALYFVSDFSAQSVSQTFTVATAGIYAFGFDVYLPGNGYANEFDATLGVSIGSLSPTINLSSLPATGWVGAQGFVALNAGANTYSLSFITDGKPAKDIVIDKLFVISAAPVPEASTAAMMFAGLATLGFVASRRRPGR